MKSITTLIFISLFFVFNSQAQLLRNTEWKIYNPSLFDTVYVYFYVDSIIQNDSQENLIVASWYSERGDTVSILDATGPYKCPNPDTGMYKFVLSGNNLTVTLIDDSCSNRAITYDGVVLERVDIPTSIKPFIGIESEIKSINSASGGFLGLQIDYPGIINVYTYSGQVILSKSVDSGRNYFDLPKGIYFINFSTNTDEHSTIKAIVL